MTAVFTNLWSVVCAPAVLALLAVFCVCAAAATDLDAALLPLPVFGGAAVVLFIAGCLDVLPIGAGLVYLLLAVGAAVCGYKAGRQKLLTALQSPGFLLFLAGAAFLWILFAVQKPMFTQWDEFTAWGLAPKMVVERGALYAADPINLTAYHTYPGTSLVSYLFLAFAPQFAEWQCLAVLDWLLLACLCTASALPRTRWNRGILVMAAGTLLPFFFSVLPVGTPSTVYASAMADTPLALLFGGALCLYYAAGDRPLGRCLAAAALALLAMTKDIAFAYGLMAVFLMGLDMLFTSDAPIRRRLPIALGRCVLLALPVLAVFLAWGRYTAAVDPQTGEAGVGAGGLGYGAVLIGGVKQLLGIGREEKFAQILSAMMEAFFSRRVCLLGSGAAAVGVITLTAAAAWLAAEKGAARRRVTAAYLGSAFCFAALYLFHLILYHYNFSELEGLALKDYERYLAPFYTGWMLAMLCLLGRSARRIGALALGGAAAALTAIFCWRGIPAAGFYTGADSLYTLRRDVQQRAELMNTVLDWNDRVLVISQGDDATRWYYYKYELTAKVVNGYGGTYIHAGETKDRWDSDFMNLVETLNWTHYDFKAVCVAETLVDYMREKEIDYLLIDRADDYMAREFGPLTEGGITADLPATLYRFEGPEAEQPFRLAVQEVTP